MNALILTLAVLSISATNLASIGRSRSFNDDQGDKWTQSDMEIWEEFGRWRRAHPHPRHRNGRDYDNERDGGRRWSDDRDRRGRDDPFRRDRDRKPYPPEVMPPSRQPQPSEPDQPIINPLPIIIEPIRPMPSIIEPYPIVETSTAISVGYPVTVEHGRHSTYYSSGYSSYYSSDYSTSYDQYSSNTATVSSVYYPSSVATSKPVAVVSKKYSPASNATASTSMSYGSTSIVTVPKSTVTTKVTGRYRAMSNSAANLGNNVAGSVSFALVLFGSLFLLILV